MNWLLVIVILIMAGCMLAGYKKGLIRTVFTVGAFVASIILVIVISPILLKELQEHTTIQEKIKQPILEKLQDETSDNVSLEKLMDIYKVPDTISQSISHIDDNVGMESIAANAKDQAANYIASRILKIISYVLTFIIINIIMWVIGIALHLFTKLPVIGGINKIAGLFLGFIEGVGCVWVLFLIVSIAGTTHWGQECLRMIQANQILTTLYESNLFLMFM